jgi:hypothetical protein
MAYFFYNGGFMKLIQSSLLVLAMGLAAPAFACDCDKEACTADKNGKMACEEHGKKCECGKDDKACNCKDKAKVKNKKT